MRDRRMKRKLTLISLRDEMRNGFDELRNEMRNGFGEVHDRIDRTNFRLDVHISESNQRFGEIESRLKNLKREIVSEIKLDLVPELKRELVPELKRELVPELKRELVPEITQAVTQAVSKQMVEIFSPYFIHVSKMLDDHENRIKSLEVGTS